MKTHIEKDYMWWIYHETCDRCGKVITEEKLWDLEMPNFHEVDFCADCLRYFTDNNISYDEAKKPYEMKAKNRLWEW